VFSNWGIIREGGFAMATDIERLLAEFRSLSTQDQDRLRKLLREEPGLGNDAGGVECTDQEYQEILVTAGLMERTRPRKRDQDAFDRFQPFKVSGKPLSETILEERQ